MLSFPDIAVLSGLALIIFGPDQMPKIARQVGQFMGTMRSTSNAFMREMDAASLENLVKPPPMQTTPVTTVGAPADETANRSLAAHDYGSDHSGLAPEIPQAPAQVHDVILQPHGASVQPHAASLQTDAASQHADGAISHSEGVLPQTHSAPAADSTHNSPN